MIIHALTRATRGSGNLQGRLTRLHAPARISHALHALTRYTRHTCLSSMTSLMTPSSTNRFDRSGNLTRSEPTAKKKRKYFDQVDLWPWLESQNFQNRPVPLNFSSTFRFWDPFLLSKLRNCANVQFPKVDFCANVDQMSKFLRWTSLTQIFAYIPILESVLSFKTWKLHKWLNSKVVDFCVGVDLKSRFSS